MTQLLNFLCGLGSIKTTYCKLGHYQLMLILKMSYISALNRSQNSESIIRGVFDSIIDLKSILGVTDQVL